MVNKIFKRWEFIYLLVIAFLPLVVNPFGLGPYEIPKQVLLILGIVFAGLYFLLAAGGKISFIFNKYVFVFAVLWLGSIAISTFFGVAPMESFWGSTDRMQGLFTWILYLLNFYICLQIFGDEKWRKVFFNLVIGVGLILSIYAILQHFRIDPLGISNIDEASGRSFATLGQPNFLGQWLIFPFVIIFTKIFEEQKWKKKNVLIFLLLITGAGLATTLNRASILGIGLSLILFLIHRYKSKLSFKIFAVGGTILGFLIFLLIFAGGFRSVNSRLNLVKPLVPLVQEHWLIGAGPETIYQTYQKVLSKDIYLTENLYDIPDRIHNETLQILLDQGIVGLALYLFLIGFLVALFFKKGELPFEQAACYFAIIAYFISVQFSFSISSHMTVLLAMVAILLLTSMRFSVKTIEIKNILSRGLFKIGILMVCIFYLYTGLSILMADVHFDRAINSYFSDSGESINSFDLAIKLNPNSRYYLYNASNLLSAKEPTLSMKEGYLDRLGLLTNYGYHYDLAMANYYSKIKDVEKMDYHFEEAARKAPNWPLVWQQWGGALFEKNKHEAAAEKYENLLALAPKYWTWSTNSDKEKHRLFKKNNELFYMAMHRLVTCYEKLGRKDKAEEISKYL